MRINPDPVLQPLSRSDVQVLRRWIPRLVILMLVYIGLAYWRGAPLVDIDATVHRPAQFRIDINSATWSEIAQLPGIGEVMARRIVEYREQHGPFRSVDELVSVQGIGEKLLERGRNYVLPIQPPQEVDD